MKLRIGVTAVTTLIVVSGAQAQTQTLDPVVVTADRLLEPTRQTSETVYTGTEITTRGIEVQGARAATSVYEALKIVPGVHVETSDATGVAAEQREIRVRGVRGFLGALTLDGVPNYGNNPIGPRDYIYDMENIESIALFKGAVPGDIGTGVGSRGGAINLRPLWARDEFGVRLSQSLGSDSFTRTFGRVDSGSLNAVDTRFSASYSYAEADKWKGPGKIGPRNNFNLTVVQPIGQTADLRLWVNYNDLDQHFYRALTFEQTQDLSANRRLDFNDQRTGIPAEDRNYFGYNKGSFNNTDFVGFLTLNPTDEWQLSLKPYLSREDTTILQGVAAPAPMGGRVQKRVRDGERKGVIMEGTWSSSPVSVTAGYLFENANIDIYTENYPITPDGLVFQGLGVLATAGDSYIHSPYMKLAGSWGNLDWQAGLKYFRFEDAASKGFTTPPPDFERVRAPDLDRDARNYDILLPTLGLGSQITDNVYAFTSYGRNFVRPYMYLPLVNLYNNNRETFTNQGIALNDLFDGFDIEESDNIDIGVRFVGDFFEVGSTLFYSKHKNLMTTVFDPRVNLSYNQNVGKATAYGIELESNFYLHDNATAFVNPTYTVFTYDDDLTFQGATLRAKGNQVVDTPEWMLRAGMIFAWNDLEVIPSLRYTGSRYGDVEHREKIDSYTVADLKVNYTLRERLSTNRIRFSLELNNIFNEKYISRITASDDSRGGAASYFVGAPFTALASATVEF